MKTPWTAVVIDEEAERNLSKGNSETRGTLMYSSTLGRHAAVTTTSLFQVTASETRNSGKAEGEFHHLHVAWVLAADPKGNPRPRMHWLVD